MCTPSRIGQPDALTVAMDKHFTDSDCAGRLMKMGFVSDREHGSVLMFFCKHCHRWVKVPVNEYDIEDLL